MTFAAVFDAGKTRLKLTLTGLDGQVAHSVSTAARVLDGPIPGLDVDYAEAFLIQALSQVAGRWPITALVPVGHAAAAVWVRDGRAAAPPVDYEAAPPQGLSQQYESQRPAFNETYSPILPLGLNLGRQLAWTEEFGPEACAAGSVLAPWPQYWALRLCGHVASEISSLGSHTDLWAPLTGDWSSMATRRGWADRFAPLAEASAVLGVSDGPVARAAGLANSVPVLCGAHDSNAALHAARQSGRMDEGGALVSTGTWTVVMAPGGQLSRLDAAKDCLANVAIDGQVVPTARFMGGREHATIAGSSPAAPTLQACHALISRSVLAIPPFAAAGPFMSSSPGLIRGEASGPAERAALGALHYALMVAYCLDLVGATGVTLIEGPLAQDPLAPGLLAAISGRPVMICHGDGVNLGAASLALGPEVLSRAEPTACEPHEIPGLDAYARQWREVAEARRVAA